VRYEVRSHEEMEKLSPRLQPGDRVDLLGFKLYIVRPDAILHTLPNGSWLEIIDPPSLTPISFPKPRCASCNGSGSVPGPGGHYDVACTACGGSGAYGGIP